MLCYHCHFSLVCSHVDLYSSLFYHRIPHEKVPRLISSSVEIFKAGIPSARYNFPRQCFSTFVSYFFFILLASNEVPHRNCPLEDVFPPPQHPRAALLTTISRFGQISVMFRPFGSFGMSLDHLRLTCRGAPGEGGFMKLQRDS